MSGKYPTVSVYNNSDSDSDNNSNNKAYPTVSVYTTPFVLDEIGTLAEAESADGAFIGFLAGVRPLVLGQISRQQEARVAVRTLELLFPLCRCRCRCHCCRRLSFGLVDAVFVANQTGLFAEPRAAEETFPMLFAGVNRVFVFHQIGQKAEPGAALGTAEGVRLGGGNDRFRRNQPLLSTGAGVAINGFRRNQPLLSTEARVAVCVLKLIFIRINSFVRHQMGISAETGIVLNAEI